MVNIPKRKGTAAESAVVSFLRTQGFPHAERLALQGGKDRGDITGIPGIVVEVKAEQTYTLSAWLQECRVEVENARADFGFVAAKPRMVGSMNVKSWYAIMNQKAWWDLIQPLGGDVTVWVHNMRPGFINRELASNVKLTQVQGVEAGASHSCVRIAPKGVDDPSMYYVVTTLGQMSDLLVRAGYGRRDDPAEV